MQRKKWIQAYRQAPWRYQLQLIGLISLGLVFVGLVGFIYLSITTEASAIGRDIQLMQYESQIIRRHTADLETQLARLTNSSVMQARAEKLGFSPVASGRLEYVVVPGYRDLDQIVMAPPPGPVSTSFSLLPAAFTQSLLDWLRELSAQTPILLAGFTP